MGYQEKLAKELTTRARKALPKGQFVFPKRRGYPIHDASHARNALARVSQHGTPAEKARVRAAVRSRYPEIGQEKKASERRQAAENFVKISTSTIEHDWTPNERRLIQQGERRTAETLRVHRYLRGKPQPVGAKTKALIGLGAAGALGAGLYARMKNKKRSRK
jgi:hypothetical protein